MPMVRNFTLQTKAFDATDRKSEYQQEEGTK
jgi:hypothetical protein